MLTGTPAGTRDENGVFPEDSVNGRVEASLIRFSEHMRSTDEMAVMVTGEDQ
ncbi:MAG: hypothetical protein N0C82_08095 [Candidatus Thiodiazotropha endolucinida]|nr:hypothetical protein [Candidatus Thiodiazotropha taylori]MCW4295276.1 hypothetical protein [Candidatus Thiodiazotropha endolucinida]